MLQPPNWAALLFLRNSKADNNHNCISITSYNSHGCQNTFVARTKTTISMQVQESTQPIAIKGQSTTNPVENFKPKGAFAFFITSYKQLLESLV